VLPIDHRLSAVHVRPDAEFQKKNASLAVALAETALTKLGVIDAVADTSSSSLPREFVDGIQDAVLRGRCEVKDEGKVRWHLDGAHTIDSLNVAARWFVQETTGR
jgi:folylpolyglutamate synthase/dihydropteroate synthase